MQKQMQRWKRNFLPKYVLSVKPSTPLSTLYLKHIYGKVTIRRIERTKRKHVTTIHGLEAFFIDLKKAAKQLAGRFATGASVTKNAQGFDEIVVQGDVSEEILEMLEKEEGILKGVPIANVEIVEDKKKKSGE